MPPRPVFGTLARMGMTMVTRLGVAAVCAGACVTALAPAGSFGAGGGAPPVAAAPPGAGTDFGWPTGDPAPVVRPFQPPRTDYGPGHRGVDLAAVMGRPVLAAGAGVVLYAGRIYDRTLVSIEHAGGVRTTYEPIAPAVRVGDRVRRGQVIGRMQGGHFGCRAPAGSVCLHWGAHRGETYLDPLRLLGATGLRLLPDERRE